MDIKLGPSRVAPGRFGFARGDDGDVSFDNTEAHAVMTSAIEELGSWWADPSHGSEAHTVRNLTGRAPSQVEAMTFASLQTLENSGVISDVLVAAKPSTGSNGIGRLETVIGWTAPDGEKNTLTVPT